MPGENKGQISERNEKPKKTVKMVRAQHKSLIYKSN
jgi:hypothetical protein